MQQWKSLLSEANVGAVLWNEPLAKYTTWKIGGPADCLIVPENKEQLKELVTLLHAHHIPWTQLGRGSNMLVADKGIRGAVIKLGQGFEELRFDGETVTAGGSLSFVKLSVLAGKQGLSGLEFAGGIPGSVGGAVYMNAGAHGSDVSRIFKSADIVLETGELVTYAAKDMAFDYRHSILHEQKGIVTEAVFELRQGDRKEISAVMASYKDRRRRTQPLQSATAGSVFRNPPGDHAARLIEAAGLKGLRIGGAEVSLQHANFIENTGQATAEDVLALMERIKETISEKNGIQMVPEVYVLGER
ncbi:UDP-N-acetylmuramate dehydrogenase [Paenibacillus lautus]|uniref:UDP-N-acetylenolpyruvoylglucosamine reductase n=1 Tax=Paenibacillus lautus TaxID=1401 RepID=A0A385TQ25_PAELA|nr:UDP-N-acetylmuramate dehydrogenase [Paenibacillus lautus]AYB45541.1 UDP-N-acetylmuramate dehydrogenase [Paenibacillus lautus]MBY0158248.1 UDP-N-acetylmuramate dehydrogenase [Cytobacillus firmus]MCI1772872.1 UDP-N-acetylmuramate dehydrogenase [Paenibacillus lautus]VTR49602.1 UDP-N-acetylenolpyruvoylglucosamine reductase [Actinobacillus pleuropneumoniae]